MKKLLLSPICISLLLFSCKKEDLPNNNNNNNAASSAAPTPTPTTGDGFLVAIKSVSTTSSPVGNIETNIGTAVAGFGDLANGTFTDAGTITINGENLSKQSNNAYIFTPGISNPTGIDFSNDINWSVSTPSFTYDANTPGGKGMPVSTGFNNAPSEITKATDVTINLNATPTNTDSIYFVLASQNNKSLIKRTAGNVSSITFSSAEMADLTNGSAYLQAALWNHEQKTLGGKQVHVINELVYSLPVEIK